MYRPLSLFVGLRYVSAKQRKNFISVISFISIACFAIGVTALIAVLSVMNGFDQQIRSRLFSMAPQVLVSSYENKVSDWQSLEQKISDYPHVVATAPYISGQGMLAANNQVHAVLISGIRPTQEQNISDIANKMLRGTINELSAGTFGVILGSELANFLGVIVGDKVNLITPTATMTPVGIIPRFKNLTVRGIFNMGQGFGFDANYAYIHFNDAQKIYQLSDSEASGVRLKLDDLYLAPQIAQTIALDLPINYTASDWTQQYGAFFQAIALEKTMMFFILLLIIIVAAFSLLSTLYMLVTDKQSDVAIMRTYGATQCDILAIFIIQGSIIGMIGTMIGVVLGVLLALNITQLADIIQQLFQVRLLSSSVYYVDFLPSKLETSDVITVALVALFISLLATILPAWRAANTDPAEALRYE